MHTARGFTLLETVYATAVIAIAVLGLIITMQRFVLQSSMGTYSHGGKVYMSRGLMSCLLDAASSALTQCDATAFTGFLSAYRCENDIEVAIRISGSCSPSKGSCSEVTATASAREHSQSLTSMVCNY